MDAKGRPDTARRRYWSSFLVSSVIAFAIASIWASACADAGFFNLTPDATFGQKAGLALMPFVFPGLVIVHLISVAVSNRTE